MNSKPKLQILKKTMSITLIFEILEVFKNLHNEVYNLIWFDQLDLHKSIITIAIVIV